MRPTSLFLALAALAAPLFAQAPQKIPVTGNLQTILGTPSPYASMELDLYNCASPVAVTGYAGLVQTSLTIQADASGNINSTVWPNDVITCNGSTGTSTYGVTYVVNGVPSGSVQCYSILSTQGIWNITTQQPVTCGSTPPTPTTGSFGNLNSSGFFQGSNGSFSGIFTAGGVTFNNGKISSGAILANVNNWQNPLSYGASSGLSITTVNATGSSGSGSLTLSSAGDFAKGHGVMIMHGGASCGSIKSAACPTGPTPTVTPQGATGSTSYTYKLACIDGLGGTGVAGAGGSTSTGNAALAGVVSGTTPISGNYNRVTWTGTASCYEVAIYRNNALIGTQWSGASGTQTFNDIGQLAWANRDLPASPPASAVADNYDGIIQTINGTTATVSPNLGANVSAVTMYHDDSPLMQAAINASPFVEVPPGWYWFRYPINYTKHSAGFGVLAGWIKGGANIMCDTGDICIDTTGDQGIIMEGLAFPTGSFTNESSAVIYFSRDTSNGDLAQSNILENLTISPGADPIGQIPAVFGGRGFVGIYNHAGEVHRYDNLHIETDRWMVLTQINIDNVASVFSATDDRGSNSMSQIECRGCYGSGYKFAELENAYSISIFGGYGLGGYLGTTHPWGFEVDAGQVGRLTIVGFRVEGKNGLISVAPGASLHEPYIMTDVYRGNAPPYGNATTPQIYLNNGAYVNNAALIQIDDYGGSGAFTAPVIDGVNCGVSQSTIFVGIWQSPGTCGGANLTGAENTLIGNVAYDGALLPSYQLSASNSSPTWVKLGTWINTNQSQGNTLKVTLLGGSGFSSGNVAQGEADIIVRMGNGTVGGIAPNLAGAQMVTYGSTGSNPGATVFDQLKVAATSGSTSVTNASWDIYVHENSPFAGGSYVVTKQTNDQWINSSTLTSDPGSASSSLVVGSVNVAAIQGISATFPSLTVSGQAAASGTNCVQINTSGSLSKTGYACGPLLGTLTTGAGTTDNVSLPGMTSGGHCAQPAATNSSAATNTATTYISTKSTDQITVTHAAVAGMTYDVACWPY